VNLEQVSKLESKLLLSTYERYPVLLRKGRGVYVYDDKGRRYLDLLSGIGVNALGYAHPALTKTIARQSRLLVHTSNLFYHEYQGKLAAVLTKISGLDRAFFTNSGTEAWEGALKVARAYANGNPSNGKEPKWRILALEHAFHGRTFGSLATTHKEKYRAPFAPGVPGVQFVKFNDVLDLAHRFGSNVLHALDMLRNEQEVMRIDVAGVDEALGFLGTTAGIARVHQTALVVHELVEVPAGAGEALPEIVGRHLQDFATDGVACTEDLSEREDQSLLAVQTEQHSGCACDFGLFHQHRHIHGNALRIR